MDMDSKEALTPAPASKNRSGEKWRRIGFWLVLIALMVGLRTVRLDTDAYPKLSWDTGLFTDEGYYIHNARNVVLFGKFQTDQFNNALLMPTLHLVQAGVFRVFGVGAVQARWISVAFGLLTLPVFYAALRRGWGTNTALYGVLFLGLDHVNLLYSRMALMDTPAAFVMVCAFYAFVRIITTSREASGIWAYWCGMLLGLVYATRGLAAFVVPAAVAGLWRETLYSPVTSPVFSNGEDGISPLTRFFRRARGNVGALLTGMAIALLIYAIVWYLPNQAEIARVNRYHVHEQLLPKSLFQLGLNVQQAIKGDRFLGLLPYLFRHSPVQFVLAVLGLATWTRTRQRTEAERRGTICLTLWLLSAWLLFAVVNYAPSRYYVLCYPALAGLAAIALADLPNLLSELWRNRWARGLFAAVLTYQTTLIFVSGQTLWGNCILCAVTVIAALLPNPPAPFPDTLVPRREGGDISATVSLSSFPVGAENEAGNNADVVRSIASPPSLRGTSVSGKGAGGLGILLLLWAGINSLWLWDWAGHLHTTHRDADRWLATHLPPNSVLFGDCAPGLCLDNRFRTVNVIPGLCNDMEPLEQWAGFPRYVAILDGPYRLTNEKWWHEHYPNVVKLNRRVVLFDPLVSHPVGIYEVRPNDANPRNAVRAVPDENPRSEDRAGSDTGAGR